MDLQAAEKATRRGAAAGFAVSGLVLLAVTLANSLEATGHMAAWNDLSKFVDVAIMAALSFGIWKRSRASAACLLVYFIFAGMFHFRETGEILHFPLSAVFVYFFGKAVLGAIAYHRIRRQQDPAYRPARRKTYLWWIPGVPALAAVIGLMVISLVTPSKVVITGEEIDPADLALLRAEGIVDADERIVLFYPSGLFSIRERGSVITDMRVISYQELNGGIEMVSATFGDVAAVSVAVHGEPLFDSWLRVTTESDVRFFMLAPTRDGGDKRFVSEVRNRMK